MLDLPTVASSLIKGHSLPSVAKVNITIVTRELEDFEASSRTAIEISSWLDLWLVAVEGLANPTKANYMVKVHCFFFFFFFFIEASSRTTV